MISRIGGVQSKTHSVIVWSSTFTEPLLVRNLEALYEWAKGVCPGIYKTTGRVDGEREEWEFLLEVKRK